MYTDDLLSLIHRLYREDDWINALYQAAGEQLDQIISAILELNQQQYFDTATWGLTIFERDLGIKPVSLLEDRRAEAEARWKIDGKVDAATLQAAADNWKNGETNVLFVDGKIKVTFNSERGKPQNIERLKNVLYEIKPAHLPIEYIFNYMTWAEMESYDKCWDEWEKLNLTWDAWERYKEEPSLFMIWQDFDRYDLTWDEWENKSLKWREFERYQGTYKPPMTWLSFDSYKKTWQEWDNLNLTWPQFERYKGVIKDAERRSNEFFRT